MSHDNSCRGPLIAIVGAGPSAFYAAAEVLDRLPDARIDLFDRLPAAGGLARYGVSPDHAERRRVIAHYESLVMGSGRVRFHGGVHVGQAILPADLRDTHDAVVFASGCSEDQSLGIEGEDLPGSEAASRFVGWYNGHPDHAGRRFDLSSQRAVVIGNGNVALDVARMLLMDPGQLAATDIAAHALEALRRSAVREVVVLGRRGPAQSAFTTPELLELLELQGIDVLVQGADGLLPPADAPLAGAGRAGDYAQGLKLKLLRELADRPPRGHGRRLVLRFLASPLAILGEGRVQALGIGVNTLAPGLDGTVQIHPTGSSEVIEAGLVIRCVGYRGTPMPGLPFDAGRGTLPNRAGRVIRPETGEVLGGLYVVGWQKRGPSGVIGSNKPCAIETVQALVQDLPALAGRRTPGYGGIATLLRALPKQPVGYPAWKAIDRAEVEAGRLQGRPRLRLVTVEAMRAAAA